MTFNLAILFPLYTLKLQLLSFKQSYFRIMRHLAQKKKKNTYKGVLVLVKFQDEACNFTKSNTPPRVFFTIFKLYK